MFNGEDALYRSSEPELDIDTCLSETTSWQRFHYTAWSPCIANAPIDSLESCNEIPECKQDPVSYSIE